MSGRDEQNCKKFFLVKNQKIEIKRLASFNYLESIKESQENLNYPIAQGLSSLSEAQIPDEMHNPPHTLECNSVRQQLQQKQRPGLEISVPIILDGPNDPQSTGKWLRPTNRNGTNKWRPSPADSTAFQLERKRRLRKT